MASRKYVGLPFCFQTQHAVQGGLDFAELRALEPVLSKQRKIPYIPSLEHIFGGDIHIFTDIRCFHAPAG